MKLLVKLKTTRMGKKLNKDEQMTFRKLFFDWKLIKTRYEVIPTYILVVASYTLAIWYLHRVLTKHPQVLDRNGHQRCEDYRNKEYRLFAVRNGYINVKSRAPIYDQED